eukprot:TRINITY_DN39338_c0_g1_i1.p1 TRINITY_DN39338_c0_g1~~TRINITY_DN39338_c0_g1_i1.p1  ORF type:complete len:1148 (+),score=297.26 TRINITY_DN39338_c0_g1_i1:66-3509(+)
MPRKSFDPDPSADGLPGRGLTELYAVSGGGEYHSGLDAPEVEEEEWAGMQKLKKVCLTNGAPTPCLGGTVGNPKKAYCVACASYCSFFVLMVLLTMTVSGFFSLSTDVPLYIRNHVTQKRADAVTEGKDENKYSISSPKMQLTRSVNGLGTAKEDGGKADDLTLEIIYYPKRGGDALSVNALSEIESFERALMSRPGFKDHCLLSYNETETHILQECSQLNGTAAEACFARAKAVSDSPHRCAAAYTVVWSCDPSRGLPCSDVNSTPMGLFDCPVSTGCDRMAPPGSPNAMTLDQGFKRTKVGSYSIPPAYPDTTKADFLNLLDAKFAANGVAEALRSVFYFGGPLAGYSTVDDSKDDQQKDMKDWIYDTYNSWLKDHSELHNVTLIFNGYGMLGEYMNSLLISDGMYALGSMVFVWCYIAFMTESWWLATMGMGQILMSFLPSYLLYRGIFGQTYFGVFNLLSIFIILGIGADDIFVFLDTWNRSASTLPDGTPFGERLIWTWKHASKAMLITSLTTCISFISNANSEFPAISTFGLFASLLVVCNYLAVIFFYPTVVRVNEEWFAPMRFCFGVNRWCSRKVSRGLTHEPQDDMDPDQEVYLLPPAQKSFVPGGVPEGRVNAWFREAYAPMIMNTKMLIIFVFMTILGIMCYQVSKFGPDPDQPALLPDSDNYQRFLTEKPDYFSRGGSDRSQKVTLAWGFDTNNPIDRDGTLSSDTENLGKSVYDPNFQLHIGARCIAQICDAAQQRSDERKTGGPIEYPITCFMLVFREYVLNRDCSSKPCYGFNTSEEVWEGITGKNAAGGTEQDYPPFYKIMIEWLNSDTKVESQWKDYIFAADMHGKPGYETCASPCPRVRFATAELKLTVTVDVDPGVGKDLFGVWDQWFQDQYNVGECKDVKKETPGFQNCFGYAFVRDRLVYEAFSGIAMSVGLAFVVLALATGNLVMSVYATLVIGCIVTCAIGVCVLMGWKLGILESIALVMVPGLAVDFVAHLADGYIESHEHDRGDRVRDMLANVGISVVSGAFSTLGSALFLFLPTIVFFNKFGTMIFITIALSLVWSLVFFPALLSTPLGPQGKTGDWHFMLKKALGKVHETPRQTRVTGSGLAMDTQREAPRSGLTHPRSTGTDPLIPEEHKHSGIPNVAM